MALGEETWRRNVSWTDTFNELKSLHDQAYKKVDEALKYDEEGQKNKAFTSYDEGLLLLDKALAINIECPSSPDLSWERACCMVDKMRKTRKEILSRIADTQVQTEEQRRPAPERPEDLALEPPPSYEEAMATSPSSSSASNIPSLPQSTSPQTYNELGEVLRSIKVETGMQSVKIIFLVDDVRMYFISPDGSVSAPSQPTQLRVLELEADALNSLDNGNCIIDGRAEGLPKYFLQVGEWFYPLVPDVSPCFRSDYGAFILPDVQSQVEGAAVGLILPPEADISLYELLEDVLHGVVSQPPIAPPRTRTRRDNFSSTISKGIVTGAQYVSSGLIKGAEAASNYVSTTTPKIISKLSPEEPRPVPPTLRTGAKVARSVTHTAVNVTGYVDDTAGKHSDENETPEGEIAERGKRSHRHKHRRHMKKLSKEFSRKLKVAPTWQPLSRPHVRRGKDRASATFAVKRTGKVGSATMALGRYLAPHVQRGGTKLLSKVGVGEAAAEEGVGGVLTVAAGAVEGFGTIYTGLEQSAALLGSSLANNTVKIVQHKYGEPMAEVTDNTLYTMGNVYNTTNNIKFLTPKGLAKKTATNTGKALIEPHKPDLNGKDLAKKTTTNTGKALIEPQKPDLNGSSDKPSTSRDHK